MSIIDVKLDQIIDVVTGLKVDMATSQLDRKTLHDDILEVKTGVEKMNGTGRRNTEDIIKLSSACVTQKEEVDIIRKNLNRLAFILFGVVLTIVVEHLLR